jgi:phage/plasmid-like protein (TIGR03299 family)
MHDLDQSGDQAAFVSAREDAWHRLGTTVPESFSAAEGLTLAHLDYEVTKEPLYVQTPRGDTQPVPNKYATVRESPWHTDGRWDVLGVVGRDYEVVQNASTAAFLDAVVGAGGARFETMGALAGGRRMFVSMRAPQGMMIGGRDAVDLYLVADNSHDGSTAFRMAATPIRPVCWNTLTAAFSVARSTWWARHTSGISDRTEEAAAALGLMWSFREEMESWANSLIAVPVSPRRLTSLLDVVVPKPAATATERAKETREATVSRIKGIYEGPTQDGITGTAWGVYNALVEYVDWYRPIQKAGPEHVKMAARAERTMTGGLDADKRQFARLVSALR